MKVRVQVSSIIYRGRETTEFYVFGRRISLRNEDFKFGKKTLLLSKNRWRKRIECAGNCYFISLRTYNPSITRPA